jgi:hypothetical protein
MSLARRERLFERYIEAGAYIPLAVHTSLDNPREACKIPQNFPASLRHPAARRLSYHGVIGVVLIRQVAQATSIVSLKENLTFF